MDSQRDLKKRAEALDHSGNRAVGVVMELPHSHGMGQVSSSCWAQATASFSVRSWSDQIDIGTKSRVGAVYGGSHFDTVTDTFTQTLSDTL
jgi:hypothetical protein